MSNQQGAPEFDFWEFVTCTRCHLPFQSEDGNTQQIPFWVTECGHVVCNNHLTGDQSCAGCGSQQVQVAPLQREMDAPMSDWFQSAPQRLDTLAYSVRFQMETMASLLRYYRRKVSQQRALVERARADSLEKKLLRKELDEANHELEQYRSYYGQESSENQNTNGKRRMADVQRRANGARSNSSPRSITTPVGPDRITLPPSHSTLPPMQQQQHSRLSDDLSLSRDREGRPGSSRFTEQYSYNTRGPDQSVPMPRNVNRLDPPGSVHKRQRLEGRIQEQSHMPPPPTPNLFQAQAQHQRQFRPAPVSGSSNTVRATPSKPSNQQLFQAPAPRNDPQTSVSLQTQRFLPNTSVNMQASSRAPSRASGKEPRQRMPFFPGGPS